MLQGNRLGTGVGLWFVATLVAVAAIAVLVIMAQAVVPWFSSRGLNVLGNGIAISLLSLVQVGIWQWLYVVPLMIWLRRRQRLETAKGLLIVASVFFGVEILCDGAILLSIR